MRHLFVRPPLRTRLHAWLAARRPPDGQFLDRRPRRCDPRIDNPWRAWGRLTAIVLALAMVLCIVAALMSGPVHAYGEASPSTGPHGRVRGELNREQAALIYAMAWGQSGLPLPPQAPTVHLTTITALRALVGCAACPVRGLQVGADIYLDEALDFADAYDASILLHEMVHYLQWSARGDVYSCEEWAQRERHAYAVQAHVLAMAGLHAAALAAIARQFVCR
jgi:hypothetical protein